MDKGPQSFNDLVEQIFIPLSVDDDRFRSLISAVHDEQAVEGSIRNDNSEAARLIRDKAREEGLEPLASSTLAKIERALNVVMRRYGMGRKQRRYTIEPDPPIKGDGFTMQKE